jgi:hypothetical protein
MVVGSYGWEKSYRAALQETDVRKLHESVLEAEGALFVRAQELASSNDGHVEREAISKASEALLRVKIEKLKWPFPQMDEGRVVGDGDGQ